MKTLLISLLFGMTLGVMHQAFSQQVPPFRSVTTPPPSLRAMSVQYVGLTEVSITYNRPGVKGRKIFGGLVPYNNGKPYPWRAGAEENTIITFQHDVNIEGNPLPAGQYGLHVIPSEAEWTFIFSKNYTSWGSFSYRQEEDALRVSVQVLPIPDQEWLEYEFKNLTDSSATVALKWEKSEAGFRIDVDTKKITLQSIKNELRDINGFTWAGQFSAAYWCAQNNYNLEEALIWIDRAMNSSLGYLVVRTKSDILMKLGRKKEAEEVFNVIVEQGSYNECIGYINNLIQQKSPKADAFIETVVKKFPSNNAKAFYSIGNTFRRLKDKENALAYYNKALKFTKDAELQTQITKAINETK